MNNLKTLKLLALSGAIFTVLSWFVEKYTWLSSALLNIGSGIITSVVLIYAYDLLIEQQKEKIRYEKQRRALLNQVTSIRQHYRVLLDCYRSSYSGSEPPEFEDINSFLGVTYEETIKNLDLYAASPANSMGTTPYYKYIEDSFVQISNSLNSMLAISGDHLDQSLYTAIDDLLKTHFMMICKNLSSIYTLNIPGIGRVPSRLITGMQPHIHDYCIKLCQLINEFERIEPQGLRVYRKEDWHNTIYPIGHAKIIE